MSDIVEWLRMTNWENDPESIGAKAADLIERQRAVIEAARKLRDRMEEIDEIIPLGLFTLWQALDERLEALDGGGDE